MDKCLILTTGRTGSDYLQACLDNVPGVMTFCGKFAYYKFCSSIKNFDQQDPEIIFNKFIEKFENIFTYYELENKKTDLNLIKFKKIFIQEISKVTLSKKSFLENLYISYHKTMERNVNDVKVLVHHTHVVDETRKFLSEYPESKMLITIRDPRANLKSGIVNWFDYDKERIGIDHVFRYLKRVREDLNFALKTPNKKLFVKLEEANEIKTKEEICSFLNVKFHENIMISTFASKIWSGDKLSKFKAKKGEFMNEVKDNKWQDFFNDRDKKILNLLYKNYSKFGYNIETTNFIDRLLMLLNSFLPLSFEKKTFNEFKKGYKKVIKNSYIYFKRVLYLYFVIINVR